MSASEFLLNFKTKSRNCEITKAKDLYVYEPRREVKDSVLILHGFVEAGNDDKRSHDMACALASSGYRVTAPFMKRVAAKEISKETLDEVSEILEEFDGQRVIVPSFSAGLVLQSVSNGHGRPKAICTIGSFASRNIIPNLSVSDDLRRKLSELKDVSWLSPVDCTMQCPVLIMHGINDKVIPASESKALYESYNRRGMNTKLCLTTLIEHTDVSPLSYFSEAEKLIDAFNFFLGQT